MASRQLRPALADICGTLEQISGLRDRPAGRVWLLVPQFAAMPVLAPKLRQFARDYPDVVRDVTIDESRVDIVAAGYDAGVHYGEFIERDVVEARRIDRHSTCRPWPKHRG